MASVTPQGAQPAARTPARTPASRTPERPAGYGVADRTPRVGNRALFAMTSSGEDAPLVQAMCRNPGCLQLAAAVQRRAIRRQTSDRFEIEADRTADLVMRPAPPVAAPSIQPVGPSAGAAVQRATEDEQAEEAEGQAVDAEFGIQAKGGNEGGDAGGGPAPFVVGGGGGHPLPAQQRAFLEPRFGRDLGAVRVHTGSQADASARSLGALAYTQGSHVVFRSGEYSPASETGGWLLAHELTHVAQQGHAPALGAAAGAPASPAAEGAIQRYADTNLPVRRAIDAGYAQSLTDMELEAATLATQQAHDAENESNAYTLVLQANLAILHAERFVRDNSTRILDDLKPQPPEETDVPFEEKEFDVDAEDWAAPEPVPGITRVDPARLRPAPSETGPFEDIPINTQLVVVTARNGWSQVTLEDGRKGWISSSRVETKLPDPDARLYTVKAGDTAQTIARHFYGKHSTKWGQDERYFVNVLFHVNSLFPAQKDQGITRPADKEDDWDATVVKADHKIWIPGVDYALGLKGIVPSGSFTYETWQTIKNIFVGTAGFISGLLVGALESVVDVFVGIWDMIKIAWDVIKSIVTGEIISDIKKLWDDLSKLTLDDIVNAGLEWFKSKWFADGTWSRWYNRGWLIGYIIVEILLMIFSDGIATAVKWVGKTTKFAKLLEKLPTIAKMIKKAEKVTGAAADALRIGSKALSKVHHWAQTALRIPLEIIKDTSAAALERLKGLSAWAKEKFRFLNPFAMKLALGCASPCKVNIHEIEEFLKNLAAKGVKVGAKLGGDVEKIIAALPADKLNLKMIRKKLKSRPALAKLIESAELTADDFGKIAHFTTAGDLASEAQSYRTFVRYLTAVVPAKADGDITKLNKIIAAMMKTDAKMSEKVKTAIIRQGSAIKGSMFEGFAKLNIPELGGKDFARVTFKKTATLALEKTQRTADNFVAATGEIWEIKHTWDKVPADQMRDYQKIIGQAAPGGAKVKGVNYLFPDKAAAEANKHLKDAGFGVRYLVGKGMAAL
ncbi:eCIS core domain-containing protein [Methylobacterium tarhaniae]|uniref:eCIS core domain-containing protein n=1 Tax=Methylobacterium tarhaniae TaxID=1187852 RepID=UPI003D0023AC